MNAARTGGPARTVRALVFALVSVVLVAGLRADSDGRRPGALVLLAAVLGVTALVRPLTSRRLGLPAVLGALVGTQFALHAVLLAVTTGRATNPGPVGWVCCPALPAGGGAPHGWFDLVTARAGVLLLGLQLAVAVVMALWLAGLDRLAWELSTLAAAGVAALAARGVARVASGLRAALVAAVSACVRELSGALRLAGRLGRPQSERAPAELALVRACPRRGPPAFRLSPALARSRTV